jgi:hypothetical protein
MTLSRQGRPGSVRAELPPLDPPRWATRSVREDGGVTHEFLSPERPAVRRLTGNGWVLVPTDLSLSASDQPAGRRWLRSGPTIQVEGGSYPLDDARRLHRALGALLRRADTAILPAPQDPQRAVHRHGLELS